MADNVTRIKDASDFRSRLSVVETQLINVSHNVEKLEEKVENQYNILHSRISDLRDDLRNEISDRNRDVTMMLSEHIKTEKENNAEISEKLSNMEKWRWMIMGAAVVAGYILGQVKIANLF
jgi:DNA repair exonuclease SbcCD ATPase subunit